MDNIYSIIEKLRVIEGEITPQQYPKHGLNRQQKDAPQLPALFKPQKISVLKNKTNPDHPAKKFFVGSESIEESITQEDVLSKVKKSLTDYLKNIEDEIAGDTDLKDKKDKHEDMIGPVVKTIKTDDGHELKIHGNEDDGFRITIKDRPLKSKFDNLDHAVMACEMFCHRRRNNQPSETTATEVNPGQPLAPDYVEEQ